MVLATFAIKYNFLKRIGMKISLSLSKKVSAEGRSEILLSAQNRVDGKVCRMRMKSEVFVMPEFFSAEKGIDMSRKRVIAPDVRQWHNEARDKLNGLLSAIARAEENAGKNEIKGDWLKNVVNGHLHQNRTGSKKKPTFYELAEDYIDKLDSTESYKKLLRVTFRAVARYEGFRKATEDRNFTFDPEAVTLDDIEGLLDYLRNEYSLSQEYPEIFKNLFDAYPSSFPKRHVNEIRQRGNNSVHSNMKRLKSMWYSFNKKGLVKNDPFKGFRNVAEHYGNVTYITLEERNKIAATPMPTRGLEIQRDIFVAQCRIGCRVSDLMRLTPAHIHDDMLVYVPKKTKNEGEAPRMAYVPITAGLQKLIDKYKGVDRKGRLFPCISAQKYNDAIKEVFTIAGITRKVEVRDSLTGENVMRPLNEIASSHMARRTFIANLYNKVADPAIIAQMSGHSEHSASFARYRRQENDLLRKVAQLAD